MRGNRLEPLLGESFGVKLEHGQVAASGVPGDLDTHLAAHALLGSFLFQHLTIGARRKDSSEPVATAGVVRLTVGADAGDAKAWELGRWRSAAFASRSSGAP